MKKISQKILLILLFLFLVSVTGWLWWDNCLLREDVYIMSVYAGSMKALVDYENGKLRLYELKSEGTHSFSGENRGSFEIWYWPYFGRDLYSSDIYVTSYNKKMKRLANEKP